MVNLWQKIKNSVVVMSVQNGLTSLIPILLIGAFALSAKSLPIGIYNKFITTWNNGIVYSVLDTMYNATFGVLSLFISLSIGYHYMGAKERDLIVRIANAGSCLAVFIIMTGVKNLSADTLGPKGMSVAIISSVLSSALFNFVLKHRKPKLSITAGSNVRFQNVIVMFVPSFSVIVAAAIINQLILFISGGSNLHMVILSVISSAFFHIQSDFLIAVLYSIISGLLWFCGIHGSDILEGVATKFFGIALGQNAALQAAGLEPTQIFTKQFFDVFVLMGGCGATLCFLIALLFFSKKQSNKNLAKLSAIPMLFNINEIMVFGFPIIFNLDFFIPFLLTPIVCFMTTFISMKLGLVPLITSHVEWTTPIFLGGYLATGSVRGAILQGINLVLGILIYRPFVISSDTKQRESIDRDYNDLVLKMQASEKNREPLVISEISGEEGNLAKALCADFIKAFDEKKLTMYYQPQFDIDGNCFGAEALLRWNHEIIGNIYPPLVIRIASEMGMLEKLEKWVISKAFEDASFIQGKTATPMKISVNITGTSIQNKNMEKFLLDEMKSDGEGLLMCIELTEQDALTLNVALHERLSRLHKAGYLLAIDDFSMGNTSLQYLLQDDFDLLKLDGGLVQSCMQNPRSCEVVSSIVQLSKNLHITVLAEYISNKEIRDMMASLGCRNYQGWFYAQAMPLSEFTALLEKNQK